LTGHYIPAGTPIPTSAINPAFAQIIQDTSRRFQSVPALPAAALPPPAWRGSNDYAVEAPFTDNADKGDLRLITSRATTAPGSCASAIARRRASTIPRFRCRWMADQRQDPHSRPAGCARLHPSVRRQQDSGRAPGLVGTKAGKYNLSIGDTRSRSPACPPNPVVAGGLPSWASPASPDLTPEHQSAVAEPGAARSQGELHLGQGQALAEVRL
jgi:hypothetical protein